MRREHNFTKYNDLLTEFGFTEYLAHCQDNDLIKSNCLLVFPCGDDTEPESIPTTIKNLFAETEKNYVCGDTHFIEPEKLISLGFKPVIINGEPVGAYNMAHNTVLINTDVVHDSRINVTTLRKIIQLILCECNDVKLKITNEMTQKLNAVIEKIKANSNELVTATSDYDKLLLDEFNETLKGMKESVIKRLEEEYKSNITVMIDKVRRESSDEIIKLKELISSAEILIKDWTGELKIIDGLLYYSGKFDVTITGYYKRGGKVIKKFKTPIITKDCVINVNLEYKPEIKAQNVGRVVITGLTHPNISNTDNKYCTGTHDFGKINSTSDLMIVFQKIVGFLSEINFESCFGIRISEGATINPELLEVCKSQRAIETVTPSTIICASCGEEIDRDHEEWFNCAACDTYYHVDCKEYGTCTECGSIICDSCEIRDCSDCGDSFCELCAVRTLRECSNCDDLICSSCNNSCTHCSEKFCKTCFEGHDCEFDEPETKTTTTTTATTTTPTSTTEATV